MSSVEEFLEIYRHPFHKLNLVAVKFLKVDSNKDGRQYYHFIGLFECELPDSMKNFDMTKKDEVLKSILNESGISAVYRKKFTRKLKKEDQNINWTFNYIFDFDPRNVVDFEIKDMQVQGGGTEKILTMKVKGYGLFQ